MKTKEQRKQEIESVKNNIAITAQCEWNENQLERIIAHSEDINERVQAAIALGASRAANAILMSNSRGKSQRVTGRDRLKCLADTAWKFRVRFSGQPAK